MLKKIVDLLLYGNFWIALCASSMVFQTIWLLDRQWLFPPLLWFVFGSTLALYGAHRYIGIRKTHFFAEDDDRFATIKRYRSHILLYGLIGSAIAAFYFFQLGLHAQLLLTIPILLSLGYILPVFKSQRLRDFRFVKIFAIALSFAWITVFVPGWDRMPVLECVLLFLEKFAFILAITLPFDIRDLKVDTHARLETIPGRIGVFRTLRMVTILLVLAAILVGTNYTLGFYNIKNSLALALFYLLLIPICFQSRRIRHDYFYAGLLDGTMLLQTVLIIFST